MTARTPCPACGGDATHGHHYPGYDDQHPTRAMTIDLNGCARCDGTGHRAITFQPLTRPVLQGDTVIATHWSPCPTTSEPILLVFHLALPQHTEPTTHATEQHDYAAEMALA